MNAIESIARNVLNKPPEGHRLRSFRCHLGRRFGSTICAWRKAFGGGRLLSFQRFREVCYSLHCGEHVTELWQELDPNRGGCISLWELDAEAVSLLVKVRSRMLASLANPNHNVKQGEVNLEEMDPQVMFGRLTTFVRPIKVGSLEMHEFRTVAKPLGLPTAEADKVFASLDHFPGSMHAPPACIDVTDIVWLKKLPQLVDIEAVSCTMDVGFGLQVEGSTPNMTGMSDSNGSPISSYMGGNSPLSGGPMNAWGPASPGDAKKAGGNKADTKRADS